jgi:hypothetical protein
MTAMATRHGRVRTVVVLATGTAAGWAYLQASRRGVGRSRLVRMAHMRSSMAAMEWQRTGCPYLAAATRLTTWTMHFWTLWCQMRLCQGCPLELCYPLAIPTSRQPPRHLALRIRLLLTQQLWPAVMQQQP